MVQEKRQDKVYKEGHRLEGMEDYVTFNQASQTSTDVRQTAEELRQAQEDARQKIVDETIDLATKANKKEIEKLKDLIAKVDERVVNLESRNNGV